MTIPTHDRLNINREYALSIDPCVSGWQGLERGTSETPGVPSQAQSNPGRPLMLSVFILVRRDLVNQNPFAAAQLSVVRRRPPTATAAAILKRIQAAG